MRDARQEWRRRVLSPDFRSEGCCFADVDGDGQQELVAGDSWWKLDGSRSRRFRDVPMTWLPDWGGGAHRADPHAHLRRGGGPPQYRASTYDFVLDGGVRPEVRLLSIAMHQDPVRWAWLDAQSNHGEHLVTQGGIYESVVYGDLDGRGTYGMVTVPSRPSLAWYEPDDDPTAPWREHVVGDRGGNWHGLGLGALETGGAPCILTPSGYYTSGDDVREPWTWHDLHQVLPDGSVEHSLGDVCLIWTCELTDGSTILVGASPHGRGLWRWDRVDEGPRGATYRRTTLDDTVSQLHALAVLPARPDEDVEAWIVTGKRWQAHGPDHDVDPAGTPALFRVGVRADPDAPPRVELIDDASGVGLQVAVRRLDDGRCQIATSNKRGVHVFTERKGPAGADHHA